MPTYEYLCPKGHEFDRFQKITDSARVRCPTCGRIASRRISAGAGLIFKGSGFYITDYGKDGKGPRKPDPDSKAAEPGTDRSTTPKSEAKTGDGKTGKADSKSHRKKAAS
ncbi:MAG: FmdB family zinc ribbon protein [Gemmatimonadales bacterium]